MSLIITPAMCASFNGGYSLWDDGVLLGHFPDRVVARRMAVLLDVYGLTDTPDTFEELFSDYWDY